MAQVRFVDAEKIYDGGVVGATGIDLSIEDRELLVLVGPSGCGKSTVLRMIAGLEDVTSGDLFFDGTRVNDMSPRDRNVAMVFQNYALYPHMSVHDNMAFGLKLRKLPKEEIRSRVDEAAAMLGIDGLLDRKPKALSGGQRQRVALGRAIVRKPSVFLFDEPLSNLDAKMRVQMRVEIRKLNLQIETTMVYVTHDQTEAMTLGDRLAVMNEGRILQVGTPLDLYNRPASMFVGAFIGSPAMNFVEGEIDGDSFRTSFTAFPVPKRYRAVLAGRQLVLGVRPEEIYLGDGGAEADAASMHPCPARVEVVESLGNESILYLDCGGQRIVAREDPGIRTRPDEKVEIRFNLDRVHLFDKETGKALPVA